MSNKQGDDLFSGMALKIQKNTSVKPNLTANVKEVQPKQNFQLDFLNSLTSSTPPNSNSSKYSFPNEFIFSSLNLNDKPHENGNFLTPDFPPVTDSRYSNPKKTEKEFSFIKSKNSNPFPTSSKPQPSNRVITNINSFEESLREDKNLKKNPTLSMSNSKNNNHLQRTVFDISAGQNGEFTLKSLQEQLDKFVNSHENNFIKVYTKLCYLKEQERKNQLEIEKTESEISDLNSREHKAIESNDFEEASKIDLSLRQAKNLIEEIKNQIKINQRELLVLRKEEVKLFKGFENIFNLLNQSVKTKKQRMEEEKSEVEIKNDGYKTSLDDLEKEKLIMKSISEEISTDKIEKSRLQDKVDKALESQSIEIKDILKDLTHDRQKIIDEIEEINLKLKEKYAELDKFNTAIKQREQELETIKSNFQRELTKIEELTKSSDFKEKKYKLDLAEIERKLNITLSDQELLLKKKDVIKNNIENLQKFSENLEKEVIPYSEKSKRIEKLFENDTNRINKLNDIESAISTSSVLLEKNRLGITQIEKTIRNFNSEIVTNEMRVPNLEQEKKLCVNTKNFKQAQTISNELKLIADRKSELITIIQKEEEKIKEICLSTKNEENKILQLEEEKKNIINDSVIDSLDYCTILIEQMQRMLNTKSEIITEVEKSLISKEINEIQSEKTNLEEIIKAEQAPKTEEVIQEVMDDTIPETKNDLIIKDEEQPNPVFYIPKKNADEPKKIEENILSEEEINILKLELETEIDCVIKETVHDSSF